MRGSRPTIKEEIGWLIDEYETKIRMAEDHYNLTQDNKFSYIALTYKVVVVQLKELIR